MSRYYIDLKDLNAKNPNVGLFVTLGDTDFIVKILWNDYAECAFLSIEDSNNEQIISGLALVNGLRIRNNKLPYILHFEQINGETYEPNIDIIGDEFMFYYEVED